MKSLISLPLFLVLMACGVEVKSPTTEDPNATKTKTDSSTQTTKPSSDGSTSLPLGLCSFETQKSRGCLKASIASTQFVIGQFSYPSGIKEFGRKFADDIQDSQLVDLQDGQTLQFVIPITIYNFHSGFYGVVEGSGVTYEAFHTGSGNLRLDNIVPGYYGVSLYRDFDLKVVNEQNKIVGYKCASMYTRRDVNVEISKETLLGQQINEFELSIFDKSCSGLSVVK